MTAPIFEYVTLISFFILGLIIQIVAVAYYNLNIDTMKNKIIDQKKKSVIGYLFTFLLSGFAMYLSYSLMLWAGNVSDIATAILVIHWTGVIYSTMMCFKKKLKITSYGLYGSFFYTLTLVVLMIIYGVKCL